MEWKSMIRRFTMGEMDWVLLDTREKEHRAITAAISDLEQMGYLISGVCFKNGALEIVCYPPEKEKENG
jgi:hypothetical protein